MFTGNHVQLLSLFLNSTVLKALCSRLASIVVERAFILEDLASALRIGTIDARLAPRNKGKLFASPGRNTPRAMTGCIGKYHRVTWNARTFSSPADHKTHLLESELIMTSPRPVWSSLTSTNHISGGRLVGYY